jgi:hypothetical protein
MQLRFSLRTGSLVLVIAVIGILSAGCEHNQSVAPQPLQPTLSSIQASILTPKCVNQGCHNPNGGGAPMSLQIGQTYGALVGVTTNNGQYGGRQRVNPANAAASVLYLKVTGDAAVGGAGGRMPPGSALSTTETNTIRDWINAGALNN